MILSAKKNTNMGFVHAAVSFLPLACEQFNFPKFNCTLTASQICQKKDGGSSAKIIYFDLGCTNDIGVHTNGAWGGANVSAQSYPTIPPLHPPPPLSELHPTPLPPLVWCQPTSGKECAFASGSQFFPLQGNLHGSNLFGTNNLMTASKISQNTG